LTPTNIGHLDDTEKFRIFQDVTNEWTFTPGIGLPGRILESGQPAWIPDVRTDPNFPRYDGKRDIAVRAGFAFPVLVGEEVAAVLEFFSPDVREPDDQILELMGSIGTQLGRVVERKQSEEQRFKTTVDNLPAFLFLRDLDGRFILVNRAYREFYGLGDSPIQGKRLSDLFSGSQLEIEAQKAEEIDREVLEKDVVVERELQARVSGQLYHLSTIRFPIHDISGQLVAIGGIEIDLTERKRQEEALARATELKDVALRELSAVMDAIDYGILFMDSDLKIIRSNKAYRRIWNVPDSFFERDRKLIEDFEYSHSQGLYDLSDEDWPDYVERRLAAIRKGDLEPEEFSLSNGKILQYQCFALADGGRMTTYFDITNLKQAEEALRESQERLVQALESISEAFALCDADDRIVVFNSRYRRMFFPGQEDLVREGAAFESITRQNVETGMVSLDGQDVETYLAGRLARHRDPKGPFLQQQADGRWIQIDESLTKDGGVVAVGTDITELKQAEQAVRESEALLKTVVDNIPAVVFLKSMEGRYTLINRKYEELYGVTYEQVRGRTAAEVHTPARTELFDAKDSEEIDAAEPIEHEVTIQTKDGDAILSSVLFPVHDDSGEMTAFGGIEIDITDRKRVAMELEQAKDIALKATEAKSQFLANMSHELRTPMNAIIGFTRVVMRRSKDRLDPKQFENLQKIQVSAEHLLSLINDILDLSKIEAGEVTVRPTEFALEPVIDEGLRTIEPMADSRRLEIRKVMESDITLFSDDEKVRQILINLLSNAVKFTESGSVTVTAQRSGTQVVIDVTDTGIGIPETKLDTIFEEFKQVDEGTTRAAGGTGLGLAITRHLVGILGGNIRVSSQVGSGSSFTISIPVHYTAPASNEEQSSEQGQE
jgi:PAS domain S-box-containing protein